MLLSLVAPGVLSVLLIVALGIVSVLFITLACCAQNGMLNCCICMTCSSPVSRRYSFQLWHC